MRSKLLGKFSLNCFNNAAYSGILDFPMEFILRLVVVIIGSIFVHACPAEPMLPIYLIVNGIRLLFTYSNFFVWSPITVFFLIIGVVGSSIQILAQIAGSLLKDDNTTWKKVKDSVIILMFIFLFGWFITGNMSSQRFNLFYVLTFY